MAKRATLVDARELEAIVAADPVDARRWSELQGFLVANNDPRGAVKTTNVSNNVMLPATARAALMRRLFGPRHATVLQRFQHASWRGAYLREVEYFYRSEDDVLEGEIVDLFLTSPASALIERLTFGHGEPTPWMRNVIKRLPDRPLARALRTLELATQTPYTGKRDIDLAPIAGLPVLEHLAIAAPLRRPTFQRELAQRLVTFAVTLLDAGVVRALFPEGAYPRLRELALDTTSAREEAVLAGRATPRLEILRITGSGERDAVVDALSRSAVLPRLRELHLEPSTHKWQLGIECVPARLGRAFAHLERAVVRKGSTWATAT